jgi:hypothetical protein
MKRKIMTICILLIMISSVLIPNRVVLAQENQAEFSGSKSIIGLIPGTITTPGGNVHIRNQQMWFQIITGESRVDGVEMVNANSNWDVNLYGHIWGSFKLEVDCGYWEGIFEGSSSAEGIFLHQVGIGKGDLQGLTMRAEIYLDGITYNGTIEGVLINGN